MSSKICNFNAWIFLFCCRLSVNKKKLIFVILSKIFLCFTDFIILFNFGKFCFVNIFRNRRKILKNKKQIYLQKNTKNGKIKIRLNLITFTKCILWAKVYLFALHKSFRKGYCFKLESQPCDIDTLLCRISNGMRHFLF